MKRLSCLMVCLLLAGLSSLTMAQTLPEDHWRQLLQQTRESNVERRLAEEARLQLNREQADAQTQALAEARNAQRAAMEERDRLEREQIELEARVAEMQDRLQRSSASLGEVFALYQEEKTQAHALMSEALATVQYPGLATRLKPDNSNVLPTIDDFYTLWETLQQGWIATSQVARFDAEWISPDGTKEPVSMTRIGEMQLLNAEGLLQFVPGEPPSLWPRQPGFARRAAADFHQEASNQAVMDPIHGLALRLFNHQPNLLDRIKQGGSVGYLIIALGVLGLIVALVQSLYLMAEDRRVKRQLKNLSQLLEDNVLGRVLSRMREIRNPEASPEALEARMDELLLRESANLERGLSWIKLIAAIAPLVGLLGTVTGMISTFQAITLFGTGDPTVMASGISQALVTTVQGLLVAVPMLLLHLLLLGRSRFLARTLEAESSAWLAERLGCEEARA